MMPPADGNGRELVALTAHEQHALDGHEQVIERGLKTFVEVGQALLAIRDGRLYRAQFTTFDDYVLRRWGIARTRAYQLMDAATVSTTVDVENEAQARALAPLKADPEAIETVWNEAVEKTGGKPTAAALRDAVRRQAAPPMDHAEAVEITEKIRQALASLRETINGDLRDGVPALFIVGALTQVVLQMEKDFTPDDFQAVKSTMFDPIVRELVGVAS
jgi:hypothetical protein